MVALVPDSINVRGISSLISADNSQPRYIMSISWPVIVATRIWDSALTTAKQTINRTISWKGYLRNPRGQRVLDCFCCCCENKNKDEWIKHEAIRNTGTFQLSPEAAIPVFPCWYLWLVWFRIKIHFTAVGFSYLLTNLQHRWRFCSSKAQILFEEGVEVSFRKFGRQLLYWLILRVHSFFSVA
jgi:hypothetical protein